MDFDALGDLNWLAVIVATVAYFALGAIWYAPPVFGNAWMASAGMTMEQGQSPPATIYVGPLVGAFLASVATGMLGTATGTDTASEGLVLGVVLAAGFALSLLGTTAVFESNKPNPKVWGAITIGYHAVGLIVAALILSSWQ